jgi:hypothetical protein
MRSLLTALGLVAVLVMPARAQSDPTIWTRQVRAQLAQNQAVAGLVGMTLSHDILVGSLTEGYYDSHTAVLQAGVDYIITAVCDNDCGDIDLKLFRGATLVGSDIAADDRPVIRVVPPYTRLYTILAIMTSCGVSPCRYGIAIYAR